MSAYVTQVQIETAIPGPHLIDALDDDRDGAADANQLTEIIQQASQAVDALLAARYTTPFPEPFPAAVAESAFVFACELIYARRELGDSKNPWKTRADTWRERLQMISKGELSIDSTTDPAFVPGAAITESAAVNASTR